MLKRVFVLLGQCELDLEIGIVIIKLDALMLLIVLVVDCFFYYYLYYVSYTLLVISFYEFGSS
jgi:hypothetical protein